jgi:translation initiation factor 2 subunit 1
MPGQWNDRGRGAQVGGKGPEGSPQPGTLVVATVMKIMPFGAYCRLPEYSNLEVYLPIKEVSSGWIKNIHEFIHEGQSLICKVTYYDKERQTTDVSLKKVTPQEKKTKLDTYNLEKRLNALFMRSIRTSGLDAQRSELAQKVVEEFTNFTNFVRNAAQDTQTFKDSKLPKKLKDILLQQLEASRKKKRYIVSYTMTLSTFDTMSGATELRRIVSLIKDKGVAVRYISAPKYSLMAEGKDYVEAEGKIKEAAVAAQGQLSKGIFEIDKEKLKKDKEDILAAL